MKKRQIALTLGIMFFLLVLAICIQTKTIEEATNTVGTKLQDNSGLRDELLEWQAKYQRAYNQLETLESELENTRKMAAADDETDSKNEIELKENKKYLGRTEVKGNGIVIELDDNRDVNTEQVLNISSLLVHEEDLLQIVTELFNAGADAVSINGQRIVSITSILCDGNIIRINGEKTGVPIKISAIGYPERLYYALVRPGGYLELMAQDGVKVKAEKKDDIIIPKYEGVYSTSYIERSDV